MRSGRYSHPHGRRLAGGNMHIIADSVSTGYDIALSFDVKG